MAAILTTLMRGLLGVAATIVLVAAVWSLYANRAPVVAAGEFVSGWFTPREEPAAVSPSAAPPASPAPGAAMPPPVATPGASQ